MTFYLNECQLRADILKSFFTKARRGINPSSLKYKLIMGSSKYNGEDPQWLFAQYQNGSNLLLVDCRPLGDYSKAHIEGAINISIPALMLRRLKKGNMALKNFINSKPAVEKYDMRFTAERVVLYDDNSYADSFTENPTLQYLQEKLGEDNFVTILNGKVSVFQYFIYVFVFAVFCF